jgi:cytochrome o ubiquinol oxidase subunit II
MLGGCEGVLDPHGPVGHAERLILVDALVVMLAIVIPVIAATIGFAWWFRASNTKATYLPEWEFSGTLELIVWSIPALIIIFLGGVAWFGSHVLDPYAPLSGKDKPLEVQVVSLDWKWLFIYPDEGVATVNQLFIPTGKPVHFSLTSATVWNAFFVPQLGSMIYSMAGMTTQLNLQADHEGVYRGVSAMFSGDKFSDMHFDVHAVSDDDFSKWVGEARSSEQALDKAGYAKLAQTSDVAPIATYKSVDAGLFDSIVDETATPSAGAPKVTNPQ